MKISLEKPPCYEEANTLFNLEALKMGTIFTYGDTLYNPSLIRLTEDLMEHESVHMKQQAFNDTVAKLWWQRYLGDPDFRLSQEVEAYGRQFKFLCKVHKDRNHQTRLLYVLAGHLSSPMYGDIITKSDAVKAIQNESKKCYNSP